MAPQELREFFLLRYSFLGQGKIYCVADCIWVFAKEHAPRVGYDFKLEEKLKRIARMVTTSTQAAYDFGVAACDAVRPLGACFARNTTGFSERESKPHQQADVYLKGDVNHAVKHLFSLGCLRKNEERTTMCDLRGSPLLPEAESAVLLARGSDRVTAYVGGIEGTVAAGF